MNGTELKPQKRNSPDFIRYRSKNIKKLKKSWRRPKGLHNKLRLKLRGYGKLPSIGYGTDKRLREEFKGFSPTIIRTLDDLKELKKKEVIISASLGLKKKISILNKIKELKIKVLNIKDVEGFLKKAEEALKKRREKTKKKVKEKEEKKEEKKKEKKKEEETKEKKEEKEKLEKKKVLEDKQAIRKGGSV